MKERENIFFYFNGFKACLHLEVCCIFKNRNLKILFNITTAANIKVLTGRKKSGRSGIKAK